MKTIEYFKLQAKNLYKDFKTQTLYFDSSLRRNLYAYEPKFFDVDALITDFDIDEDSFTLMNAQHIIAKLVGFEKWTEMLKASLPALELSKLIFDNMHKIRNEDWEYYIKGVENENSLELDDEDKLGIFKMVFADVDGHQSDGYDYRLLKSEKPSKRKLIHTSKNKNTREIVSLPLAEEDLSEFVEVANRKFDELLHMMTPKHPGLIRKIWVPQQYIDKILTSDKLPIDRDYALSLVDAFLVHHFIELDREADKQGVKLN